MITYDAFDTWAEVLDDDPPAPKFEAGNEIDGRMQFQSLADDLAAVRITTAVVLVNEDATPAHKDQVRAEYLSLVADVSAEMKRRLAGWHEGFERTRRPH